VVLVAGSPAAVFTASLLLPKDHTMAASTDRTPGIERRHFLTACTAAGAAGLVSGAARAANPPQPAAALPAIALGKFRVSRMVVGYNPIGGYSYQGHHMDQHMREYYTVPQTVEFLERCQRQGINTHQFSPSDKMTQVLRTMRERGSTMQFFCLHAGRGQVKSVLKDTQPFAMAHHGGATDSLFAQGKSREVHDFVKEVHDHGLLAGVSAHNPDCIKRVADEGWEVDFFMTCFHFLTRTTMPGSDKPLALPTLELSYPFFRDDPVTMTQVARQVKQPCFGFKILGSGRKCASQSSVRAAFKFAFENLKPIDGVIVGMYPRFFDEIVADAQYVRELGKLPG
jgi:hypothetical protein